MLMGNQIHKESPESPVPLDLLGMLNIEQETIWTEKIITEMSNSNEVRSDSDILSPTWTRSLDLLGTFKIHQVSQTAAVHEILQMIFGKQTDLLYLSLFFRKKGSCSLDAC